jgi:inorganic triphosphatase YgiF
MPAPPREIELKFALPPDRASELLAELAPLAQATPQDLTSVYFDTDRRSLKRAGLALRVRREDGEYVQTLKGAGDGLMTRSEWGAKVQGPQVAPELLADTPAAALIQRGGELAPQFTIQARRRSAQVSEGASRVELSLDEGEAKAGDKREPFAELELELKDGPIEGLLSLAKRIAQTNGLTLSFTTKAERGFSLATASRRRSLKFETPELKPEMATGEAFRAVARACLRQIVGNAEQLRGRTSPEVVHQLRVGIRRLRSMITTFKKVVTDARTALLKDELEWLAGELDAARNLDVLLGDHLRAKLAPRLGPEPRRGLAAQLRAARRIAYARGATAVESERFRQLLVNLLVWIEAGPWTQASERQAARERPVAKFARKALEKRRGKVIKEAKKFSTLSVQERHRLRIDSKKLRYAADVFTGLFGRPKRAGRFTDHLKAVQDCLGDLNDLVVGDALAREVAAGVALPTADLANAPEPEDPARQERMAELVDASERALKAFADAEPFW